MRRAYLAALNLRDQPMLLREAYSPRTLSSCKYLEQLALLQLHKHTGLDQWLGASQLASLDQDKYISITGG